MIFRLLDKNGDWSFGKGNEDYARRDQAIMLNIKTRLYSWLNDCFFDMKAGVDWANRLGSKNQRVLLEDDLRRIILSSEGVAGIIKINTELNGRNFVGNYNITTVFSKSYQDSLKVGA